MSISATTSWRSIQVADGGRISPSPHRPRLGEGCPRLTALTARRSLPLDLRSEPKHIVIQRETRASLAPHSIAENACITGDTMGKRLLTAATAIALSAGSPADAGPTADDTGRAKAPRIAAGPEGELPPLVPPVPQLAIRPRKSQCAGARHWCLRCRSRRSARSGSPPSPTRSSPHWCLRSLNSPYARRAATAGRIACARA